MASKEIAYEAVRLHDLYNDKVETIERELVELKEIADKQYKILVLLYSNSADFDDTDALSQIKSQNEGHAELVFAHLQKHEFIIPYSVIRICNLKSNDYPTAKRIMKIVADTHPEECSLSGYNCLEIINKKD